MMSFLVGVAAFILGPWGISLIVLGTAGMFLAAVPGLTQPRHGFLSMACGAGAFLAAYLVRTYMAGGGLGI